METLEKIMLFSFIVQPIVNKPTPRDIIQATSKQRKRQKFQNIQQNRGRLTSQTFISDTPEAFYLALDLKLDESSGDWVVNDPFQHGNFQKFEN